MIRQIVFATIATVGVASAVRSANEYKVAPVLMVPGERCRWEVDQQVYIKGDGGRLYLFFGEHQGFKNGPKRDRAGNADINNILDRKDNSREKVIAYMQLRANSRAEKDFSYQTNALKSLAERHKISWIKMEQFSLDKKLNIRTLIRWGRESEERLLRLHIPQELIDKYFVYAWGGPFNALLHGERWTRDISFGAYETSENQSKMNEAVKTIETLDFPNTSAVDMEKYNQFNNDVMLKEGFLQTFDISKLPQQKMEPDRTQMLTFIKSVSEFDRVRSVRDELIVSYLLGVKGNGAMIIGYAHRPGIIKGLEHHCNIHGNRSASSP